MGNIFLSQCVYKATLLFKGTGSLYQLEGTVAFDIRFTWNYIQDYCIQFALYIAISKIYCCTVIQLAQSFHTFGMWIQNTCEG